MRLSKPPRRSSMISKWPDARPELRSRPSHHEPPAPIGAEAQPPAAGEPSPAAEAVATRGAGLRSRAFVLPDALTPALNRPVVAMRAGKRAVSHSHSRIRFAIAHGLI